MSDDRDSGVDPRPERWLVPTDDDEQLDVPSTSTGRHSLPETPAEQDGSGPSAAEDAPTTTWPAAAAHDSAVPSTPDSTPADAATSAWSAPADPETAAWSAPADEPAPAAWSASTDPTADEQATSIVPMVPSSSAWSSGDARTELIPSVPAESENTSILAAVAADQATRSPDSGRGATRAATRAAARPKTGGDRVRTVVRGIGQTFITLGVIVLLFVVYEVYITDIFSAAKQKEATAALDERWVQEDAVEQTEVVTVTDPNQLVVDPASRTRSYEVLDGEGFAKISIPAFGADYHLTIISGTNPEELVTGPGHYPDSQYPGEQGNFAMAGHRVSKGSPFNNLDQLNSCDAIIIETQTDWFVYRVLPMDNEIEGWDPAARANCAGVEAPTGAYDGIVGREITLPTDYAQVLPIPHVDSYTVPADAQRLITLTTCHPQFSDAERMIIHGTLVKTYSKSPGFIPPEMQEG